MFNATRVAAAVAIFALGASVALITGPRGPSPQPVPGQAVAESPVPPVIVSGASTHITVMDLGEAVTEGGVPTVHGNISEVEAEMDDPRVSGTYHLTQSAEDHGGMGPMWGTMRVENEDGTWEGPVRGYWTDADTHFSGCLTGGSAHEGLTYCMRVAADVVLRDVEIDGLVYQGGLPPVE